MTDNIYSPEYVKGLFNRMSSSYERMNYLTSFGFSIRWRYQFLNHFTKTEENVEIIDLLSGMGETWNATKRMFPNANITAVDFSIEMIKSASRKSKTHFNNEVTCLLEDVLNNTLPSGHFDFVICAFGLKTFNEEQLACLAAETQRILKVGGQFSFIEVSKPKNKLLELLYGFYLGSIIPILGKLLLANTNEYKMLWQYTSQFIDARRATEIFNNVGLKANFESYFYNCATGFVGSKL